MAEFLSVFREAAEGNDVDFPDNLPEDLKEEACRLAIEYERADWLEKLLHKNKDDKLGRRMSKLAIQMQAPSCRKMLLSRWPVHHAGFYCYDLPHALDWGRFEDVQLFFQSGARLGSEIYHCHRAPWELIDWYLQQDFSEQRLLDLYHGVLEYGSWKNFYHLRGVVTDEQHNKSLQEVPKVFRLIAADLLDRGDHPENVKSMLERSTTRSLFQIQR